MNTTRARRARSKTERAPGRNSREMINDNNDNGKIDIESATKYGKTLIECVNILIDEYTTDENKINFDSIVYSLNEIKTMDESEEVISMDVIFKIIMDKKRPIGIFDMIWLILFIHSGYENIIPNLWELITDHFKKLSENPSAETAAKFKNFILDEVIDNGITGAAGWGGNNADLTSNKKLYVFKNRIPEKHVIPNNKLANSLTKDIINAGTIDLIVSGKGKNEITSRCVLSYEGENIKLSSRQPFTEYDRQVADAVTSLYEYGDKNHIITASVVYRTMIHATETETPSPQQIGAVTRSLDKMRFVRVQIDCSEELTQRNISLDGAQITGGKIDTYLLALDKVEVEAGGQKLSAYKIIKTPILYDYSRLTGQVLTVPASLLDVRDNTGAKVPNTERRIAVKGYLLRRISVMKGKHGKKQSRHIMYDTVYIGIGETNLTRRDQQLIREYIVLILDNWKRAEFIKGHEELTQGRKKTGVKIII